MKITHRAVMVQFGFTVNLQVVSTVCWSVVMLWSCNRDVTFSLLAWSVWFDKQYNLVLAKGQWCFV